VFGDEQYIYVVPMGDNNKATGSRVFRAYDGVSVRVPEFSGIYEQRTRVMGRHILATNVDLKNVLTMRVYDVLEGKDVWRKEFPQGSIVMQSEDPRLVGVVEPAGVIRVLDVQTQKEVLLTKLADPKHANNPRSVHLLSDPDYLFVAFNGQLDNTKINGEFNPNLVASAGLRSVPVNGWVYAFNRKTGKTLWHNEVDHQHLVISQFEDLPLLFFTASFQQWLGPPGGNRSIQNTTAARAIAKHNGKLWYLLEGTGTSTALYGMNFHDLKMDHRTGKVEMTGYQLRVTMTAVPK